MTAITSVDFLREAYSEETGITVILLITITHPNLAEPIYISTDPTARLDATTTEIIYGTISGGINYVFLPLRLILPSDGDEGPGLIKIEIDNIHQSLIPTIRSLSSPAAFNVDIVTSDAVNTILASWPEYLLTNVTYDHMVISADLILETLYREPFPAGTFNPSEFPGIF